MQEVSSLAKELKAHLPWHQARITCFSLFVLAIIQARSSNLLRVAEFFQCEAEVDSSYRRIKRFLSHFHICFLQIARLLLAWMPLARYTLCLDRTNWKHGKKDVNFLVLSVVWQGCSVPILWACLPKAGASNSQERIDLMTLCLKVIPADKIDCLLADREFIGDAWFRWLIDHKIRFRMRVKNNTAVVGNNGKTIQVWQFFDHVRIGDQETWKSKRLVAGLQLHIAAHRSVKGLLVVVSPDQPDNMVADYYQRWAIEVLFGNLKSRGFNLEHTHIVDPDKLKKLMAVLAVALLWSLRVGEWKYGDHKELPLYSHWRPAKSLFRLGLDVIRRVLNNRTVKTKHCSLIELIQVLSPT